MSIAMRAALAAVVLMMSCAAVTRADDRADISKAGVAFSQALQKGDAATAKKYAVTDERTDKMIDSLAMIVSSRQKLEDAAVAKFGEAGKQVMPARMGPQSYADWKKEMADAKIEISGDTATVTSPKSRRPAIFKKIGGQWKIDLKDLMPTAPTDRSMGQFKIMVGAIDQTTAQIKDGKYSSADEARQGLATNMRNAFMGARGGPASGR